MPFTTGIITSTRAVGTAATNVVVSTRNVNSVDATILVKVFGVPITTLTLTPFYVISFIVPANTADIREFFIAGNVAYEVQISNLTPTAEVVFSTYGLDEMGNIVDEQRVLQSELTPIPVLSTT
ncbi:hypothetical protein G8C92_18585 [Paenibacillus donghaensis]|uniref:hypothetical protein n=1 Tax=Paenibacillus donghaensis TaxID=414771 RepID=UPI001883BA96|nr:hypothetical protein [Paenibacillus donghaensis]MBE9916025.1 hypothetical protein [Paenibacillus donghaensis]